MKDRKATAAGKARPHATVAGVMTPNSNQTAKGAIAMSSFLNHELDQTYCLPGAAIAPHPPAVKTRRGSEELPPPTQFPRTERTAVPILHVSSGRGQRHSRPRSPCTS